MTASYTEYRDWVMKDLEELKKYYPFSTEIIHPYAKPQEIEIRVVAVCKRTIEVTGGLEQDFLDDYSKELRIKIPFNYKEKGCEVYGAKWIDIRNLDIKDRHFFSCDSDGSNLFCVGVPESFSHFDNVILENVKTAENMLIAYERFLSGKSRVLELKAYSHGQQGRREYEHDKKRYK